MPPLLAPAGAAYAGNSATAGAHCFMAGAAAAAAMQRQQWQQIKAGSCPVSSQHGIGNAPPATFVIVIVIIIFLRVLLLQVHQLMTHVCKHAAQVDDGQLCQAAAGDVCGLELVGTICTLQKQRQQRAAHEWLHMKPVLFQLTATANAFVNDDIPTLPTAAVAETFANPVKN